MIYLATPYTHEDPAISEERFQKVSVAAGRLMMSGHNVYSPISHTHPIAMVGDLPTDWSFWEKFDSEMLSHCNMVMVLMLPGWDLSRGVAAETALARKMNLPILYIDEDLTVVNFEDPLIEE